MSTSDEQLRLAYFHGTQSKIRILENVQTGEIGRLTEAVHEEDWHVRKILTVPSVTWRNLVL